MQASLQFSYDPYQPVAEVAELARQAAAFRQILTAQGVKVADESDRDILFTAEINSRAKAIAAVGALIEAQVPAQVNVVGSPDSKDVQAVAACYTARGLASEVFAIYESAADIAARDAFFSLQNQIKADIAKIVSSGEPTRARLSDGSLGWADDSIAHPDYGQMVRITLDDGRVLFGNETSWRQIFRAKLADGREGWIAGYDGYGPFRLDDGTVIARPLIEGYSLSILPYPTRPAAPGRTTRTVIVSVAISQAVSNAQDPQEAEAAIAAAFQKVVADGLGRGRFGDVLTVMVDEVPVEAKR